MKCELCGDEVELYYEENGKNLCMACYDNPNRDKTKTIIENHEKKEIDNICINCHKKVNIVSQKLQFIDGELNEITLCSKCYDNMPKEEKLKLMPTSKKPIGFNPVWMAGLVGGVAGRDVQRGKVDETWKKYDIGLEEINEFAIMNFNRHFLICDNSLKAGIMARMGKELKKDKLNEIAGRLYNKDFESCEGKERRIVKKELKKILKENFKKNKDRGTLF